ncbi:MAG TPA: hypothetical protein VFY05_04820 [Candidatus Angelobacter sp.]|nr:hypothetical protein [Candidatus Angelobacter sp.]
MADEAARVRDSRQPGHCWADNEIIAVYGQQLGPYGVAVYMVFSMVAKNGTGECNITLRQIAKLLDMSPSRVLKSVDTLMELGLVSQTHKSNGDGKPSTYTLMSVDKITKEQTVRFFGTLEPVRIENRGPVLVASDPVRIENRGQRDPVRNTNTNNTNKTINTTDMSDQRSDTLFPEESQDSSGSKNLKRRPLRGFVDELKLLTKDPWELEWLPRVWKYYCERTNRGVGYMATPKRARAGLLRLRDAVQYTGGDKKKALKAFQLAIDNLTDDEFLSGQNNRGREYRDWIDNLCKSWEEFEKRLRSK